MEKGVVAILVIGAFVVGVILTNPSDTERIINDTVERLEDTIGNIRNETNSGEITEEEKTRDEREKPRGEQEEEIEPPDIRVDLSLKERYYLGDRPSVNLEISNFGGPCEVEVEIRDQEETGNFTLELNKGTTREISPRKEEPLDSIGDWDINVGIEAQNEQGHDSVNKEETIEVTFHHLDGKKYINEEELEDSKDLSSEFFSFLNQKLTVIDKSKWDSLVTSESETIKNIVNEFRSLTNNNRLALAKDLYYWVSWWISYNHKSIEKGVLSPEQWEVPVQTIHDKNGVCINYSLVLSSLYEAAGYDAELLLVYDEEKAMGHALVLLYTPNYPEFYQPPRFNDSWTILDPTWASGYLDTKTFGVKWGEFSDEYHEVWDDFKRIDVS